MNPASLIPTPDVIPAPWGWFKFFLIATFLVHILLMNIMLGGGIITFLSGLKSGGTAKPLQKDFSEKLTIVIAFVVNFGVAPLLFLQVLYGHFMYVSSQLMAVFWMAVIPLLILAYYSAYIYKFKFDALGNNRNWFIGSSVAILLVIAFIYVNNMTLMLRPDAWTGYFENDQGTLLNLSDPTLLPRYLHFLTGSIAIGGLFIALLWTLKARKGAPDAKKQIDRGMDWFVHATLIQVVIGFWFQMSLPRPILLLFMGGSPLHTGLFLAALGLVILVLILAIHRKVLLTTFFALFLVTFMVLIRDLVRTAYLDPYFRLSDLTVEPQYGPLVVFLLALIFSLAAVGYVVYLARQIKDPGSPGSSDGSKEAAALR